MYCLFFLLECEKGQQKKIKKSRDIIGLFLNALILLLSVTPSFVIPIAVFGSLDPYHYVFKNIIPSNIHNKIYLFLILIRIGLEICVVSEFCRGGFFGIAVLCLNNRSTTACLIYLDQLHSRNSHLFKSRIHWIGVYNQLRIILKYVEGLKGGLECLLLTACFAVNVLSNWIALKMYNTLPLAIYLLFPLWATIIPIITSQTIPKSVELSVLSIKLLRNWRIQTGDDDVRFKKIIRRKLKSLPSIRWNVQVNGYGFKALERSFKIDYFGAIVDYTVNCVMSFDVPKSYSRLIL